MIKVIYEIFAVAIVITCVYGQPFQCIDELTSYQWMAPLNDYTSFDFNVIVFGNFYSGSTGDVEGRVAAAGNVTFGDGFSVGYAIHSGNPNATDFAREWSLVVGENLEWDSGALFPEGNGIPYPGEEEDMYVGGDIFNTPEYLSDRATGGPCPGWDCLEPVFEDAYAYYLNLSYIYSATPANAQAELQGDGMFLSSDDRYASRYYVQIPAAEFSQTTYWSTDSINSAAEFIVTITGTGDITFQGGNFPGVPELTVFNIQGERAVYVENAASGSLLAVDSTLYQTGGDEIGLVIVGEIAKFLEALKPRCAIMHCCRWCPNDDMLEL